MTGEFFVNNLLACYNDRIDLKFYLLPDSAQIFYRRMLLHHDFTPLEFHLSKISEAAGLRDGNESNLVKTVETSVLNPLKGGGYISSYEKLLNGNGIKYRIERPKTSKSKDREGGRVGKETRQGR